MVDNMVHILNLDMEVNVQLLDHGTWSMYEFEPGIELSSNFTTLLGLTWVDEGFGNMHHVYFGKILGG